MHNPPKNIFGTAAQLNGRLPDHHPTLINEYLVWGHYELAKHIFYLIHKFVKIAIDSGSGLVADIPIPFLRLAQGEQISKSGQSSEKYAGLFDEDSDDSEGDISSTYNQDHADFLGKELSRLSLPNISDLDQVTALALSDMILKIERKKSSLDENGMRYVIALSLYIFYAKSSLTAAVSSRLAMDGLESRDIAWAFYSDSQDTLLSICNQSFTNNTLTWKTARALGLGLWIKSPEVLVYINCIFLITIKKRTVEQIARNQYMLNDERDPIHCSLFYLALKKKSVLHGYSNISYHTTRLWKLANAHPDQASMIRFLGNDFSEERWKSAATKNAYALLGKQRFEYAVAFFLLADRIGDAVDICVKRLNDFQLALVLCRIYLGDGSELAEKVLRTYMLPSAIQIGDRWLLSMSYSLLQDKKNALYATFMPLDSFGEDDALKISTADPALVLLFNYLIKYYKSLRMDEFPIVLEHHVNLIYGSAFTYDGMGCPMLALKILELSPLTNANLFVRSGNADLEFKDKAELNEVMDRGAPVSSQSAPSYGGGVDWGEPVSTKPAASSEMDWGEPVSSLSVVGGMDWGETVSSLSVGEGMDWGEPITSKGIEFTEFKSTLCAESDIVEPDMLDSKIKPKKENITYHVDQHIFDRLCVQRRNLIPYRRQLAVKVLQVLIFYLIRYRLFSTLQT
jgi:hypothetical protein